MIEVFGNVWVGGQSDYVGPREGWCHILAAKEPWHREALGYKPGQAAPSTNERICCYRNERQLFIINWVDVADPAFFKPGTLMLAHNFIDDTLAAKKKVSIHCNKGESRSACIALSWLLWKGHIKVKDWEEGEERFKKIYPPFNPRGGVSDFCRNQFKG